ncbi:MAG: AhpC/TSA family protein [Gammaproteobacteria bacterium]|nr:AhpC/TSA family protein [Chromatiales bacterium]MYE49039.1 AhpC/TSA family protein [Gammaproteobacteria bacterium]
MRKTALPILAVVSLAAALAAPASHAEFAASAEETQPLPAGVAAPSFTARNADGSDFVFDPSSLDRPAMLIFYRGGWCPYCNRHLAELRHVVPELEQRGMDVYFLSADSPANLASALHGDAEGLDYTLLSDARMGAAQAFGLAFRVSDDYYQQAKEYGLDLEEASGETHHALPVPAVYVIDAAGTIRFAHSEPDYTQRLGNDELRAAVDGLLEGGSGAGDA